MGSALVDAVTAFTCRDRAGLSGQEAVQRLSELNAAIALLTAARLSMLSVVQESGVWGLDASRSAAAWLARQERSTRAAAGSDLKLARVLDAHLPLTSAALREGAVPVGHARVLARTCLRTEAMRVMLADPDRGEAFLLTQAGLGAEDFARFASTWSYRVDPDAVDAAYRESTDDYFLQAAVTTGGVAVRGFLDPVAGECLISVLRAEIGVPAVTDTRGTPRRMHDALASVMNRVLAGGRLGDHASLRPSLVVHVPYATLEALSVKAPLTGLAPATLQESGTPIPRTVLDRLVCDSAITRVIFGPLGQVLDVGRAQRTFTGPRRRALDAHDGGCMYPGCHAPPCQCEGHHTDPGGWAGGATTDATHGGILLCYHHHPHVHDHHITIHRDQFGNWVFTDRHGQHLGTTRPRSLNPDLFNPDPWDTAA